MAKEKRPDEGLDQYSRKWAEKDAKRRKQGFPPSKLGPGVPAITTTSILGGTWYKDDNGDKIPKGVKG